MIELKDLYALKEENEKHISEIQAENRVLDKLIAIENSKCAEPSELAGEETVGETVQQDESY